MTTNADLYTVEQRLASAAQIYAEHPIVNWFKHLQEAAENYVRAVERVRQAECRGTFAQNELEL